MKKLFLSLMLVGLLYGTCLASINVPSDGSDGVFNPTESVEIDLSQAATAAWNTASLVPGKGVYDADKWAVVFKYSEVNIPSGVTVTFKNHPGNPPVVWLVSGNVTIDGAVNLDAKGDMGNGYREPGPGGFRLGPANGLGPGGGLTSDSYSNATYAGTYGNASIIPLIGGSGGRGYVYYGQIGAGGGAILIACDGSITLRGSISAQGGYGASGGGVRLVADSYSITGNIYAASYAGTDGRIRLESLNESILGGSCNPAANLGICGTDPQIWPTTSAPSVKIAKVSEVSSPADPKSNVNFPMQDISITAEQATSVIRVEATNVPLDWAVKVRVAPRDASAYWVDASYVSGDANASIWEAQTQLPKGMTVLQARANKP